MLPPAARTRTSSRRLSKSLPRARSTSCHRRSVHCYGVPQYSAMSSPRTCFCRCSGTLRPRSREPNYSPGCQASLCRPVTSYAFVTRFFGKSRTPACPIDDAANCMRRPLRFWKPPPPRRTAAPRSSHFTTSWPATTTRRWTTAGGPGSGRWRAMRQPPPPTPTEGRPRLPDFPQASARASVRSTWKRWAMQSSWQAGRPRLPQPTWKRCGACAVSRYGRLIWPSS